MHIVKIDPHHISSNHIIRRDADGTGYTAFRGGWGFYQAGYPLQFANLQRLQEEFDLPDLADAEDEIRIVPDWQFPPETLVAARCYEDAVAEYFSGWGLRKDYENTVHHYEFALVRLLRAQYPDHNKGYLMQEVYLATRETDQTLEKTP